nr:3,4-dihydroxy-2-butanone-4-phosphate synthase [Rhodococcus sp. (in: high G+C Gram-positive bacteria)]
MTTGVRQRLADVALATAAVRSGRPVLLASVDRHGSAGHVVVAAEKATAASTAFMIRYTSGFLCVPMLARECTRLGIPPMWMEGPEPNGGRADHSAVYGVSVDAASGTGTGISASDRAATICLLARSSGEPSEFTRPGHVVPMRVDEAGLLAHRGSAEASVDLVRASGLRPAAAMGQIVSELDERRMAEWPELGWFAAEHRMPLVSVDDVLLWRRVHARIPRVAKLVARSSR